ncbi:benzaldehyde lyase [Colletotrichum karsti]|uniref:Benzaldehyde lyase n=1 Tax=Colletotrichum karsti TaxID=1095194 RepID=A0A9P6LLB1_9PEZI|nr:benzaldehyde lyase [Colletotrichum karsti]KAF9880259.1 benzaldehyde lyase [Colletotrichum karsti]
MDFPLKHPKTRELLGGDLLAQCLAHLGVTVAFGIHGGHLDSFLVAAVEADIKLIDVRHETVAVQAAEGWAKVKGNSTPGVCFVTANSGFCNGLPGLATAYADRSPVFCITSSPPLREAETNSLQGFHDQVVLAKAVTKLAHRVTTVTEIPRIVSLAWRATTAGAPGPVLVDFPIDILFMPVEQSSVSWGSIMSPPVSLPAPSGTEVEKAMDLWKRAKRPVIIVSTGASGATEKVIKLAESTNTPVFHSPKFSTGILHSHPLFGGSATQLPILRFTGGQAPDFVLLLGVRSGFLMGGRSGAIIPNDNKSKVVQVDLDGSEIGRSTNIDVGIVADVGQTAAAMSTLVEKSSIKASDDWVQQALGLKKSQVASAANKKEPVILPENKRLHPYHGVSTLFQSLPEGSLVCIDGGEAGGWAIQCLNEAKAGLSMVSTGYLGFLGNGFGYSLGAALADPDRLVINLQGDGSAGFHLSELDTYAKFDLKILTVVVNNAVWGMSQAGQDMMYGEKTPQRPCVAMNPKVKYDIVAQGFGCKSAAIDVQDGDADGKKTLDFLGKTVEDMTKAGGPALLDLKVSDVPYHGTTKAMVGKSDDPNVIVVPYYDNLPRPYYKTGGSS